MRRLWFALLGCGLVCSAGRGAEEKKVTAVIRGSCTWDAFDQLAARGLHVYVLCQRRMWQPNVPAAEAQPYFEGYKHPEVTYPAIPAEVRFREMDGRKLVEAVAAFNNLKIAWYREGRTAVLYRGCADAELDKLKQDLVSENAEVRRRAAWEAPYLEDVRAVPPMVAAAQRMDPASYRTFVTSFYRMGWPAVMAVEPKSSVDFVLKAYKAAAAEKRPITDWEIRKEAACGAARTAGLAVDMLKGRIGSDQKWNQYFMGMYGLAFVDDPQAGDSLRGLVKHSHVDVRRAALTGLGYIADEPSLAVLEAALKHQDANTRVAAAWALGRSGTAPARAVLKNVLTGDDALVVREATLALARGGTAEDVARLEQAVARWKPEDAARATSAIGEVGSVEAVKALDGILRTTKDHRVRNAAELALGEIGSPGAVAVLRTPRKLPNGMLQPWFRGLARSGSPEGRAALEGLLAGGAKGRDAAVTALAGFPAAMPVIEKALLDPDPAVRRAAISATSTIAGSRRCRYFEGALKDPEPSVLTQALEEARRGGFGCIDLAGKGLSSPNLGVRRRAVECLGACGEDGALRLLATVENDKDVGQLARDAIKRIRTRVFGADEPGPKLPPEVVSEDF